MYKVIFAFLLILVSFLSQGKDNFYKCTPINKERVDGVAIIVHGLNVNPDRMLPFVNHYCYKKKFITFNLRLSGHRGSLKEFKKVSRDVWLSDFENVFKEALKAVKNSETEKIDLVGYSLGAVVSLDYILTNSVQSNIGKMVFFAPAFTPRWYVKSLLVYGLMGEDYVIPSRSLASYRSNSGTPVLAYKAMYDHIENVKKKLGTLMHSLLTAIIYIDPRDKLVSYSSLNTFIKKNKLSNWVVKETHVNSSYNHLVIAPEFMSRSSWDRIIDSL